ncbi:AAA domain containing protein [uncultured Caudovirales phage]|uniref:AAA domain containing protein n=1 Tax=uncultured Caudovirales phage TaxID=2100421 RepID=A0A6J5RTF1_9CAUD|nr:AAA domain containing protein [uncultured Caudovirales phage]CAB4199252.1 AAA domain containing protein [uncultured Caudovirales phage]CAB4218227.1 AAA domain containing protein [uncultured Caudovirales phage]
MSNGIKFICGTPRKTPDLPTEVSGFPLPAFVHQYLSSGAAEGERNEVIYKVAQQFYACQLSQADAESRIVPMAVSQGGPKVAAEVMAAIRSAYRSSKVTEPLAARTESRPGASKLGAKAEAPEPDFIRAIKAAFQPHEWVAIIDSQLNESGVWKPAKAELRSRADWEKWHAKMGDLSKSFGNTEGGTYMGINPFKAESGARSNDNVSSYRHVLVEWDGKEDGSDKPEQRARIEASGLPVTLLIDSGKRSIHAWVRVDAKTREEWDNRRDRIFADLGCDEKNKDVARVSRCAGAIRIVNGEPVVQRLLATNIGAASWGEWETKRVGLPPLMSLAEMSRANPRPTPEVIKGILNMGCKMLIAGPSKARKSWVLLDLCLSVALGRSWLGHETKEGKCLFINFELADWMLWDRVAKIAESRGMMQLGERGDWLQFWNLRGRINDMSQLTAPLIEKIKGGGYSLVVVDPVYKGMGARDENAAGDINSLLNELETVCGQTGVALAFSHHFAKGNAREKGAIDRMSGSGVWARDPDAVLTLTPPEPIKNGKELVPADHDLELEMALRAHPPQEMSLLHWRGFHFDSRSKKEFKLKTITDPKEGSYAAEFGPIIRMMPELDREAAEEWFERESGLPNADARKAFDALKKVSYGLVEFDIRTKKWRGMAMPF